MEEYYRGNGPGRGESDAAFQVQERVGGGF